MAMFCAYEGRISEEDVSSRGPPSQRRHQAVLSRRMPGDGGSRHVERLFRMKRTGVRHRARVPRPQPGRLRDGELVAALVGGARWLEGSICGIGGGIMTPPTMGAVGNLATEDIVHVLNEMNVATGIATEDAVAAAWDVARLLDITPRSHVTSGGTRTQVMIDAKTHARTHPA